MVSAATLHMQYTDRPSCCMYPCTCEALSRQTSHLWGLFRLQMLCIKAAEVFNTHLTPCAKWYYIKKMSRGAVWTLFWPKRTASGLISQSKSPINKVALANSTAQLIKGWSLDWQEDTDRLNLIKFHVARRGGIKNVTRSQDIFMSLMNSMRKGKYESQQSVFKKSISGSCVCDEGWGRVGPSGDALSDLESTSATHAPLLCEKL